jgi:hypothetical protein
MTDPIKEDLSANIIFFRDLHGEAHTIQFDAIITFSFDRYRYYLSYIKPNNGGYSYCYLDDDDPTNYVIYHGEKYTNLMFNKLILVAKNEKTEAIIDNLP